MEIVALLAGLAGLLWVWARGARRDHDQLRERQQQWSRQDHDEPVHLSNPDYTTGPPGPGAGGF